MPYHGANGIAKAIAYGTPTDGAKRPTGSLAGDARCVPKPTWICESAGFSRHVPSDLALALTVYDDEVPISHSMCMLVGVY